MIYFNEKKEAFAYKIDNYIAFTTDEVWQKYSGTDKWDIVNGKFADITDTEEYKAKKKQEEKEKRIKEIKQQLKEIDEQSIRSLRDNDTEYIEKYKNQAKILREELRKISEE